MSVTNDFPSEVKTTTTKSFVRVHRGLIRVVASAAAALATSAHANVTAVWQADVYYPMGSIVSYQGRLYEARVSHIDFHGSERTPAASSLWKAIGASSGLHVFNLRDFWLARTSDTLESRCAPAWNADNTYTTGGLASVNGVNYRASWWTRGESPVSHSAVGEPWSMIGSCSASSKTAAARPDTSSGRAVQAQAEPPRS